MSSGGSADHVHRGIWKSLLLGLAAIALVAALIASALAINGLLAAVPQAPADLRPDGRGETLPQSLTLERFRLSEMRRTLPWKSEDAPQSGTDTAVFESLQRIARNLDSYVKNAFPPAAPLPEATEWSLAHVMKRLELKDDAEVKFYLGTLESLSSQLASVAPEQALLPVERRIDPNRVLSWHAERVQRVLSALEQDNARLQRSYQQRVVEYANRQARALTYAGIAAVAVFVFISALFLFFIIRIERDLHTMALASVATVKQLNA
jgi:hypothetical protein